MVTVAHTDQVVVNVIGAGQWGPNLIRNFVTALNSRISKVCDRDPARLALLAKRFPGIELTQDANEAIHDPAAEAVAISTPVATHFALASEALAADKDVFVEKPLAASVEQCEQLIELADQRQRILMVGHIFRFNPGIRYVKELLDSGQLGTLISLHAVRTNLGPVRTDVNALWDLGAHDLSIFRYWLRADPCEVTAAGLCHLAPEIADTVIATYIYPNQVMATVHASWLHPRKVREITIVSDDQMVVWDDISVSEPVRIYNKGVDRQDTYADTFGAFQLAFREGDVTIPPVRGDEPLAAECSHFVDCVLRRQTPLTDAWDGVAVVRALAAADDSLRNGSQFMPIRTSAPPATASLSGPRYSSPRS